MPAIRHYRKRLPSFAEWQVFKQLFPIVPESMQRVEEKFEIDQLKNKGRYYMAKIVRPDGSTIQRLLIDKQTGSVQMVGR